jgi:hypothetical protein
MRIVLSLLVAAIFLAGCAKKPMEVDRITQISPANGAKGLDVYASKRKAGEAAPEMSGDQVVPVRTYIAGGGALGGRGKEFAGANCIVKANNYEARVTTPAKIRVPIYRMNSSMLSVRCEKEGFRTKTAEFAVYNKTKNDRYAAGSRAGVAGLLVMAVVNGLSDESKHDFLYPPLNVEMTPIGE